MKFLLTAINAKFIHSNPAIYSLRAGAALVIAGLAAKGTTELSCVQYIERGYEDLVGKLRAVGADIAMVDVPEESEVESHIS